MSTTTIDRARVAAANDVKGRANVNVLPSALRLSAGLAVLRVIVGVVFAAHGAQKLFTFGLGGVAEGFGGMGIPMAGIVGPAVAFTEFFGGIALAIGLFTPIVAAALAVVMVGAILMVHLPAGFFLPNGYEFTLTLFAAAVALAVMGPGTYSVDALLKARR